MRLISHVHSAPDPDGLERLPQAPSSTLADLFDQAKSALEGLSSIAELPDEQQNHAKVHAAAEELAAELESVGEELRCLPDDPLTGELCLLLDEIATRVQAELDGTSTEPGFASQIAGYFAGEITDELIRVCTALYWAIEWDIDPRAAAKRFAQVPD